MYESDSDVGVIYNATDKTVETKAVGKWFSFPPGKIKLMNNRVAEWIGSHRLYEGLITLPPSFQDPEFRTTPEGKRLLKERHDEAIKNRVTHLTRLSNNIKSMQKDYDRANIKIDARTEAEGEYEAMVELASYQAKKEDEGQKRADKIKELEAKIKA